MLDVHGLLESFLDRPKCYSLRSNGIVYVAWWKLLMDGNLTLLAGGC